MSINIPVSKVSGGACWAYSGHTLKRSNILTLIIRLWGLPWKQAIFLKKTTTYEGPPNFFEVYIHISF